QESDADDHGACVARMRTLDHRNQGWGDCDPGLKGPHYPARLAPSEGLGQLWHEREGPGFHQATHLHTFLMANALVIGMGGVGSVIGQKLHSYSCFDRIVLPGVHSRFEVAQLNATETHRLAEFMHDRQINVTLNACTWQANHSVLDACAQAGSHYLDMAADIYSPLGVRRPTKNSY